ncbi:arylsulfotransferase family protein [Mycobacterium haemophilum]
MSIVETDYKNGRICQAFPDRSNLFPTPIFGPREFTVKTNKLVACDNQYILYSAFSSAATRLSPLKDTAVPANIICTTDGHVVWESPAPPGKYVFGLNKQQYKGRPVLTWWEGHIVNDTCGDGSLVIADNNYGVIKTVRLDYPAMTSLHEFKITDAGHALFIVMTMKTVNASLLGGSCSEEIYSPTAIVYDLNRDRVLFEWHADEHTDLSESFQGFGDGVSDPYHMNSLDIDRGNRLLISLRAMSSVFCVDIRSGREEWRVGGKNPTVKMDRDAAICFQHDARFTAEHNVIRVFNNNSDHRSTNDYSEIKWLAIDKDAHRARLVKKLVHPDGLISGFLGNATEHPDGTMFGSWGSAGHIYALNGDGQVEYDAHLPIGPYRAYLDTWLGQPEAGPQVRFDRNQLVATWNGATGVREWRLLVGQSPHALAPFATETWRGYQQTFGVPSHAVWCAVEAIGAGGVVCVSNTLEIPR